MLSERRYHFPGTVRLKRRADFQRVYRHGIRVTGRHVVLFLVRTDRSDGRFGVTASRKIGGAVTRTRCKRRLRELYRLHRGEVAHLSADVVANARRSCASAPWSELEEDFTTCLRRGADRVSGEKRR